MNLKEIKEKNPSVWSVYCFWKNRETVRRNRVILARDLYDFFDRSKIWIEVVPVYDFEKSCIEAGKWYYTINNGIELSKQEYDNITYGNRRTCEESAFIKAFQIMDVYINQHKISINEKTGKVKISS